MIYKLLMNYFRFKFFHMVLSRVMSKKLVTSKHPKAMSLLSYGLELLATLYFNGKKGKPHTVVKRAPK